MFAESCMTWLSSYSHMVKALTYIVIMTATCWYHVIAAVTSLAAFLASVTCNAVLWLTTTGMLLPLPAALMTCVSSFYTVSLKTYHHLSISKCLTI